MSDNAMIPMADAQKNGFSASTKAELRAYYEELFGEAAPPNTKSETLQRALLRELGISNEFTGAKAVAITPPSEPIFPDYKLDPNGEWGGRRHRIKASRPPDATKNENCWIGSWNGGPDQVIRYGEVECVPEPIYLRLRDQKFIVPKTRRTFNQEDGSTDVTTELMETERHQITYLGVDPNTAHLAGSLTEWYQWKGPEWFRARSHRELQQIAQKIEMGWQDQSGRALEHKDIQDRLIEFFFGHAEAKDAA